MGISESLYFQLIDQLNLEYTLAHIFRVKAENEKDSIVKVIYLRLRDDSSRHLSLISNALKMIGKEIPKPRIIKVMGIDPSTMRKEEISINEVDTALEELEVASATLFALAAEDFPDPIFSRFFWAMRDDEKLHLRLLRDIKAYRKEKRSKKAVVNEPS